jgi:hypothetical protein
MLQENSERLASMRHHPSIHSIDNLRSVLGIAGEHIGDLVWWTLSDASTPRPTLEATWTGAGLPNSLLPEAPTADKAFKTAVRACQAGVTDKLVRLGKDEDDELVYAIVHETKTGDGSLQHHQEARVLLNRAAEQVSSDVPDHTLVQVIRDGFHQLRDLHTPDDVRRAIVKALRSFAAVTLREGGGVYWVPRTYQREVRQLEKAIRGLGASRFYVVPVHHTSAGADMLGDVAKGSLETELHALQEELKAFQAEPPDRPSTLERRLDAFTALRSRAQLYRDILQVQVDDLEAQLDAMAATVASLLQTASC